METIAIVCSVLGAVVAVVAAVLLMRLDPSTTEHDLIDGGGPSGTDEPSGIALFLREQSNLGPLVLIGTALQLLGVVVGLFVSR